MRLFVAVELCDRMRDAATEAAEHLKERLDPGVRVTWMPPDKMHLTVRFIGHVDEPRVPAVCEALQAPLPVAPFDIALGGCGAFPRHGPPRVFWIGLSEGMPSLQAMHDEFNRRLRPLGFAPEDRPFNAHLTLARIKDLSRELVRTSRETLAAVRIASVRCRIDRATIFQSQLSPKGSTYVSLAQVPCDDVV